MRTYNKYNNIINVNDDRMYWWISQALDILKPNVDCEFFNTLAIYSTIDACRIDRASIENKKEIIFISRNILPKTRKDIYEDPGGRYFIFVVLHEAAHAQLNHKSPTNEAEFKLIEDQANKTAFEWLNGFLKKSSIKKITLTEIEEAKAKSKEFWGNLGLGPVKQQHTEN